MEWIDFMAEAIKYHTFVHNIFLLSDECWWVGRIVVRWWWMGAWNDDGLDGGGFWWQLVGSSSG